MFCLTAETFGHQMTLNDSSFQPWVLVAACIELSSQNSKLRSRMGKIREGFMDWQQAMKLSIDISLCLYIYLH